MALLASCCLAFCEATAMAQSGAEQHPVIRLWEGDAPGAHGKEPTDIPTITLYRAGSNANGSAVVVLPGGGYGGLAPHEGAPIAEWCNSLGATAVVVKYRLGSAGYRHPVELGDAQRAIRMVRAHASEWGVDPHRVGIIGFSAGGHLASTTATHFDAGNPAAQDPVDKLSCRPDLAILCYPVITMTDPFTHAGSRANLLGANPSPELIQLLSNEKQVTNQTPPCFLLQTADDAVVPCENALLFAMACHRAGVPVELHMYEHGPHGIGLGGTDPVLSKWPKACAAWMEKRGFFKQK